ncbi:hypothetical protein LTR84_011852 [Exophiala bonariae]|uniref:Peptidase C45 hydrolase domain-containing protein n=1 Tax=Exophiala bonariae TaxID=1690606 RepID=A0AAV9NHK4_9EURO|nr:hypothetical protein LTR84_011852 [Exophiala bonariae]
MLEITCTGSPVEIGRQHGEAASQQVAGSLAFYRRLFEKYTGKPWDEVHSVAKGFATHIAQTWSAYYEEMEGVAWGSGQSTLDIVALNVRSEIMFGLMNDQTSRARTDGCTTVVLKPTSTKCFMGQNWDWMEEQKENLLLLTIISEGSLPKITMVTEAGIIGKIGLNSAGVGVCLNAIRARGLDETRLPVHLALRMALNAQSAREAAHALECYGVGGAAHIMIADAHDAIGLEFTSSDAVRLSPDAKGRIVHSNHMIRSHRDLDESTEADSFARLDRIQVLTEAIFHSPEFRAGFSLVDFAQVFDDHEGYPVSICRAQEAPSEDASLFTIVMDLQQKSAVVTVGRPCCAESKHVINFD